MEMGPLSASSGTTGETDRQADRQNSRRGGETWAESGKGSNATLFEWVGEVKVVAREEGRERETETEAVKSERRFFCFLITSSCGIAG